MKIYKIEWLDHEYNGTTWQTIESAKEFHSDNTIVTTIGYLVSETEEYIIITDTICPKLDLIGATTKVLKINIKSITNLITP